MSNRPRLAGKPLAWVKLLRSLGKRLKLLREDWQL